MVPLEAEGWQFGNHCALRERTGDEKGGKKGGRRGGIGMWRRRMNITARATMM